MEQWWHYKGQVTATIDLPGKPGYVLRPRQVFEAPPTSVAALFHKGLIAKARPPRAVKAAKAEELKAPAPTPAIKSEEAVFENAHSDTLVVASESPKALESDEAPLSSDDEPDGESEDAEEESDADDVSEEPQSGDVPKTRRKKRRGQS
jgi:hypothetical protein